MAFGDSKGTLTASVASVTNPTNATGSVSVAIGDLIFVNFGQQTNLTAASVTDNLGNSYSAVNAGTDAGTAAIRCFYARVTVAGTLTTVSVAATASTNDASCVVTVIEGPFVVSPLDANPANTSDATTPFTCPATGTLAQAHEVVMAAIAVASNQTVAATSPSTLAGTVARANISTGNSRRTVSATTTVTPEFTGTSATAAQTTASFKKDLDAPLSGTISPAFTTSGALTATAALSGTTSPAFTTSGALQALSTLSGTVSPAFTTSGTLAADAALSGTTSPTFTTAATLAADAALSAASSVAFSTSAALSATADISGSAEAAFTASGALSADAALSGTVAVAFSASGNLDIESGPSEAALFGTVSLAFVASGDLSVSGGEVADLGGPGAHKPAHVPAYAGDYRYWLEQKRKLEGVIRQLEKARAAPQSAAPITAAIEKAEDISDRLRAAIAAVNESDNRIQQIVTALILARDMHKRMIDEEEEVLLLEML